MFKIRTMNAISHLGTDILAKQGCEVGQELERPDALLIRSADLHGTEFWPELKCIGRAGAGTNNIPLERCSESGIVVFNAPGANADATKEMVIFQLLVASRDILGSIEWVKSIAGRGAEIPELVEKGKSAFAGPELCGKNLGVIGLGAIGVLVASTALKLGMTVRGYDPYMSVESAWRLSRDVIHVDFLEEIFRTSDYISLNVPYNESTHHMIDAAAIAAMRPGVRIVNESRAEIVDDEAMIEAMEKHTIQDGKKGSSSADSDEEGGSDPMLKQAVEVVIDAGQASTSLLQRRCKLGYARAARIMDEMEEKGIIGPYEGAKPRAVLISRQQWLEMQMNQPDE